MNQKHLRVVGFAPIFVTPSPFFCGPSCCEVITWSACSTIGSDQCETTVGTPSRTYSGRYLSRKHFFSFCWSSSHGEKHGIDMCPFFTSWHPWHHDWFHPFFYLTVFWSLLGRFGSSTQIARKSVGPNEPCKKRTKSSCYGTATAASVGEPGKDVFFFFFSDMSVHLGWFSASY